MRLYRLLTGPDDDAFCERVERLLNKGWQLHGPPTLAYDGTSVRAAQAIVFEKEGEYEGFVHLKTLYPPE